MDLRRLFLYLLIASVSVSALIGIGVILFGDFGRIEVRVLMSTLTVTVTSVFGLACGAYLESGRGKVLPWSGIALAAVATVMSFLIIWDVLDESETFIKSFLTAALLAAACSYLSLLSLARLDRRFGWTRTAAVVCVSLVAAILLYILWFEPYGDSDLIYRVLGILGVLLASITVVTPVLHRLSTETSDLDAIDSRIERLKDQLARLEDERARIMAGRAAAGTK